MTEPPNRPIYVFSSFRLDTAKHRLSHDTTELSLTPKAVEVLTALIERRGDVVERDELMRAVWPDVVVEDSNLSVTVSMLRKTLGEHSSEKFIETVPRRGYRFVADVQERFERVQTILVEKHTLGRVVVEEEFGFNIPKLSGFPTFLKTSRGRLAVAAIAASVVCVSIGAWIYAGRGGSIGGHGNRIQSIAVLPFRSIHPSGENGHQGLGLADILITRLSNIKQINVRPTSAVVQYQNAQESSTAIGQKLLVDAVLEGSILQVNDRVRITAQLVRVSDQTSIWSGQFERSVTDQLKLQDDIALQVVSALALNLSGPEERALTKRYTQMQDAYQLYLKGRYYWTKRGEENQALAQREFRSAIEKDPNFALAYVGLADSLMFFNESIELHVALEKALELDPNLPEAWASKGFLLGVHEWRWKEAEEAFQKSLALNPGYSTAHHWYAILLGIEGRYDEAKAELRRALEIDPMSYNFLADLGQVYYFNHEYEKAAEYCNKAVAIYPPFTYAHIYLYGIYLQTHQYESAIEEAARGETGETSTDNNPRLTDEQVRIKHQQYKRPLAEGGIRNFYTYRISIAKAHDSPTTPSTWAVAVYNALLGNKDESLDALENALKKRTFMLAWVKAEPIFDGLRSEPRFKAILQQLNLPPDE